MPREITKTKISITVDKKNLKLARDNLGKTLTLSQVFDVMLADLVSSFTDQFYSSKGDDKKWLIDYFKKQVKKEAVHN